MTRYESRVKAAQTLYQIDIAKADALSAFQYAEWLNNQEDEKMDERDLFAWQLIDGVVSHLDEIDAVITANLVHWTLSRMSYMDRAIIRLAVYEMMHTNVPTQVIINEAIEITKAYTDLDDGASSKFNNKLLDTIAKVLSIDE